MIEALLKGGADANEQLPLGRRPLMLAARSGHVDAVRALLDGGADVNAKEDARGTTALMQAADQGHADVIAVLIERGADVAAASKPVLRDGRTAALGKSGDPRSRRPPAGHRHSVRSADRPISARSQELAAATAPKTPCWRRPARCRR